MGGSHTSIHPSQKDVFIYSELEEGIGYASGLPSPITTHEIYWNEANYLPNPNPREGNTYPVTTVPPGDECWVNFNSCGSALQVVEQRAIWVKKKFPTTSPGVFGATLNGGPPHELECIEIYVSSIGAAETETNTRRVELDEDSFPQGVPAGGTAARLPEYKRRVIGHEIGHGVGLYHPFDPIPSSERPSGARPRYHDRLRYNNTYCQYEAGSHVLPTTVRHGPISRCKPGFPVWDSGSTIMDYGSETEKIRFIGDNRYSRTSAHYLAAFLKSTTYLASIHNVEYMFVSPSVAAAHAAKTLPDPLRKSKPQWAPPSNDGTSSDTSGTQTSSDTSTTNPSLPSTPTNLNAFYGNGQVRLSWTAGGGTTTDYQYRYRESGGSWHDWVSVLLSNPDVLSDTEVIILSLINGTTYEFQVRAMNGESASAATESSESTPATVPGKPTSLIGDRYNRSVTLRWYPPDDDGGAEVTDYEYRYSYTYGTYGEWTPVTGTNTGTNRNVSIGGLTNGRQYKFRVRAKNIAGYGAESRTIYKTPATTPTEPVDFTVTAGDSEVTLEWSTPYSNGGLIITDYEYSYRESSSNSWGSWTSVGTDQSATVSDLTNGTEYEFCVYAENSVGSGSWAGPSRATPEAPAIVSSDGVYTATAGDSHTANLSVPSGWTSIYWYLKAPSESGLGTSQSSVSDSTGNSSTASYTYSFPSGVSGDYVLTAYTTLSDSTIVQPSYTVSVSLPAVSAPVWSNIPDPYNLTVGDSFTLDLSSYVTGSPTITKTGGSIPAGLSFSNGVVSGTVSTVEVRNFRFTATNSTGSSESEWVNITVAAAPVPLPVWSDIPDPYNLTLGDSFSLDLSSYVSGSPTLTKTGGSLPAGLSFSNGVVSGTVSTVEVRNFRFTATNSIGSSESEWIRITVSAPP